MRRVLLLLLLSSSMANALAIDRCMALSSGYMYELSTDISFSGSQCFSIAGSNTGIDCGGHSIMANGSGAYFFQVTVQGLSNVSMRNCRLNLFGGHQSLAGVDLSDASGVIEGNVMQLSGGDSGDDYGVIAYGAATITGNDIAANKGVKFWGSGSVEGNMVRNADTAYSLSGSVAARGNTAVNATMGFVVQGFSGIFSNNTASLRSDGYGLYVMRTQGARFFDVSIQGGQYGVMLWEQVSSSAFEKISTNRSKYGFFSRYEIGVFGNNVSSSSFDNGIHGISISSQNYTLTNVSASGNQIGALLTGHAEVLNSRFAGNSLGMQVYANSKMVIYDSVIESPYDAIELYGGGPGGIRLVRTAVSSGRYDVDSSASDELSWSFFLDSAVDLNKTRFGRKNGYALGHSVQVSVAPAGPALLNASNGLMGTYAVNLAASSTEVAVDSITHFKGYYNNRYYDYQNQGVFSNLPLSLVASNGTHYGTFSGNTTPGQQIVINLDRLVSFATPTPTPTPSPSPGQFVTPTPTPSPSQSVTPTPMQPNLPILTPTPRASPAPGPRSTPSSFPTVVLPAGGKPGLEAESSSVNWNALPFGSVSESDKEEIVRRLRVLADDPADEEAVLREYARLKAEREAQQASGGFGQLLRIAGMNSAYILLSFLGIAVILSFALYKSSRKSSPPQPSAGASEKLAELRKRMQ